MIGEVRTTLVHLPLEQFDESLGMLILFRILANDFAQLSKPPAEGDEICFIVDGGLVHMVEDLLVERNSIESAKVVHVRLWRVRRGIRLDSLTQVRRDRPRWVAPRIMVRKELGLTRIDATWQYVAGASFVLPIVRKKRERRANTSASVVSRRLL